ncbi:MAG: C45 family autoproteolytic acyltransferase/hydrolase, partial [Desulfobacteraceae bacterium]
MLHKNYYEIRAKNYFDLGFQEGQLFGVFLRQSVKQQKKLSYGDTGLLTRAKAYLKITKRMFPYLLEELEGYAEGARVPFDDLWLLSLEDELFPSMYEKCTTVITNHGLLIAHNEDWDVEAMDAICVLKKTVQGLTILELYYLNTLGGNAISVNSNGFVQTINTLTHSDTQIGVPKNIIARWLSETNDPESDFKRLEMIQRASGYSHNFCRTDGAIWNFECSAKEQILLCPNAPFIHTNHFLTRLGR